ncbi:MAG: hypothetical protein IK100_04305 [Muribaculaceae bacterium]|nr:hypothetical protein [Muribaculaceae bacterium]
MHLTEKIGHFLVLLLMVALATTLLSCHNDATPKDVITQNEKYTVGTDKVVEGKWVAEAKSATHLVTNYQLPPDSIPAVIKLRLAINGHDNELRPGEYHYIDLTDTDTTIIKACVADNKRSSSQKIACQKELKLKIDLSPITNALSDKGFFVTPTHDTIYADDNKGVWVTANIASLDIDALQCSINTKQLVGVPPASDGIYTATIDLSPSQRKVNKEWKINSPNGYYPLYESPQKLMDVIHNMSIEVISSQLIVDSVPQFMVSQECYAIALALAYLEPEKSMQALKSMVTDSIITSGDSIETYNSLANKMIWATAAWNVYCVNGDKEWLKYAYDIITKNLAIIENSGLLNRETGLYRATCPYMVSNINQYYPPWTSVADVLETSPLLANAIMEHAYRVVEMMSDEFEIANYRHKAESLKDAINHRLWDEFKGYYSQYLYGGPLNMMSPCSDNMGQALCVLWDIADDNRGETLVNETHLSYYGIPLTYPINMSVKPEFNNAVIPMVQALWNLAAARNGNIAMLRRGIGAQIRLQALLASCDVSSSATTGAPLDISYPRGNAAGNLSIIYNVIAGMKFLPNGIEFTPKVPMCFQGKKTIKSFKYRNAVLDITINGTGTGLSKISLDGKDLADNFIDENIRGHHTIVITMNDIHTSSGKVTVTKELSYLPETPLWQWDGFYGTTYNYNGDDGYKILINDEERYSMRDSVLGTRDTVSYRSFSIMAVNKFGSSYISKPHFITTTASAYEFAKYNPQFILQLPMPRGYMGSPIDIIEISDNSPWVSIPVTTTEAGDYIVDVLYSNGDGQASLASPCQMLEVTANGHLQGVVSTPPLGEGQWLCKAYSSRLNVRLLKGSNTLQLRLHRPSPQHGQPINLRLSHLRIIKRTPIS